MDLEGLKQFIASIDEKLKNQNLPQIARDALTKTKSQAEQALSQHSTTQGMGDLSKNLLDFNSQLYKDYSSYLQKNVSGIGVNTLLAPLMAGGTGYAGGMAMAGQQAKELARERQDKINAGVQGFALGNINLGANLLGQKGSLQLGYAELNEQRRQYNDQNSGWNQFFKMLGSGTGLLASSLTGGSSGAGQAVAGYGG